MHSPQSPRALTLRRPRRFPAAQAAGAGGRRQRACGPLPSRPLPASQGHTTARLSTAACRGLFELQPVFLRSSPLAAISANWGGQPQPQPNPQPNQPNQPAKFDKGASAFLILIRFLIVNKPLAFLIRFSPPIVNASRMKRGYFDKPGVSGIFRESRIAMVADFMHIPATAGYHEVLASALVELRFSPALVNCFKNDCRASNESASVVSNSSSFTSTSLRRSRGSYLPTYVPGDFETTQTG
jgi:hypothetical protein